ncbi:MAG: hypothetical protein ACYSUI_23505, partial [Planctomycetota bacterium]
MDAILTVLGVAIVLSAAIGAGILIRKNRVLAASSEPEKSPKGPVPVARFGSRHDAEMALGYLKDAGIEAALLVDDAGGAFFG